MFYNLQRGHLAVEVMIPTKITGESVPPSTAMIFFLLKKPSIFGI